MQGKIILEKQSIKKLVMYKKISMKEEEVINSLIRKYYAYIYVLNSIIYIVEFSKSKFPKTLQKQLINEYKYQQNNNIYSKKI
jgi:hypothetical protein